MFVLWVGAVNYPGIGGGGHNVTFWLTFQELITRNDTKNDFYNKG